MVFSREFVDFVIRHNLWPSRHKRSAHRDYNCPRDYFLLWHGRTLHRAQIIIILAVGQVLRNGVIVMWESRKSQIPISVRNIKGRPFWSRVWVLAQSLQERNALNE